MTVYTQNNNSIEVGIAQLFRRLQSYLSQKSGKFIAEAISTSVKNHFGRLHPGSSHFDPNKANASLDTSLNQGVVDVDVPGISRAYHDIDILPKTKQALTIPMHREAYGKKAADFDDLFLVKRKDGKAFLARNNGGNLSMMFFLAKHVHQRKDSGLMPTDDTLAINSMSRLSRLISDAIGKEISNI